MGVHGLIPYLKKACPGAIKTLRNRFQDIEGKRIVIDGTLITQRLHFAPSPHPYRHVLGWYRIGEELHRSGISAVCVFDGKGKHVAKAREVQRRKATQKQALNRGQVEDERVKRLKFVHGLLEKLHSSPPGMDDTIARALEALKVTQELDQAYETLTSEASNDALREISQAERDVQPPLPTPLPSMMTSETLSRSLRTVFSSFRASINLLASQSELQKLPDSLLGQKDKDLPAAAQESLLTKAQSQLCLLERDMWLNMSNLSMPAIKGDSPQYTQLLETSSALLDQSSKMSVSFARRTNLPSRATYEESRAILEAMGIPCINAPVATEGEGFAAAIALHGDADYVVSEDTDVLAYGAPLIRNISNVHDPLELIEAKAIPPVLELDDCAYLDFLLLFGTDFTQRIKNVGPQRAYQFIKRYHSIEAILKYEPNYPPRIPVEEYLEEVDAARLLFSQLPRAPDLGDLEPVYRSPEAIAGVLTKYRLGKHLVASTHWNSEQALAGNYFSDSPVAL